MERITGIEIEEGCILIGEIAIISYLGTEGSEKWGLALNGSMLQSQIIGLLEMAQHGLLTS